MRNQENVKATLTEIISYCSNNIKSFEKSTQTQEDEKLNYIHDKSLNILHMGWPKEYPDYV
jgi:hypothetical protein